MKRIVIVAFLLATFAAFSQDTIKVGNWAITGKASLNISQVYFANWAAGGSSNLTLIGKYTMTANYNKDRHSYFNWLDMALGYSLFQDEDPLKTEDKIEYITSYLYELNEHWYFSVMGKFASQFVKGYDYSVDSTNYISRFMAPGYFDIGPGIRYEPVEWFFINLSPATASWIIVNDQALADAGSFGLDPAVFNDQGQLVSHAKKSRMMFGAKMMIVLQKEVAKNVNLGTKLELFSDYLQNPQNIDINWQVLLGLKVNDWLNVDIQTTLLYDDDVMITDSDGNTGPRTQFREFVMIGLAYSF
jgi:hypothetical protein